MRASESRPQSVCVLICTCNRHEMLGDALRSLAACDPRPDRVVVVNGGDERADAVADRAGSEGLDLELVKTRNINLAVSRNIGLEQCEGDIVAMTDDDAEVFPDWIASIRQVLEGVPEAGAVGGPVIGAGGKSITVRVADRTTFPIYEGRREVRSLPGVNIAYRREALEAAGHYDPRLFRGEDVDFNWRVIQAGFSIVFDPSIRVYHHHRPSARALLNQHYMYGRAYHLVRRKWPEMHCVYPKSLRTLRDIRKLAWFCAAPVMLPLAQAVKMGPIGLPALPLLYAREISWRAGILQQMWLDRKS